VGTWLVTPHKFLAPDQVAALRASIEGARQRGIESADRLAVRNAVLVELLLGTGLRASELCGLCVGDILLDHRRADVLVRRGKGGKPRLVAISGRLSTYLVEFVTWNAAVGESIEPDRALFISERGGRLCRSALHRIWKATLKHAGLPTTWGVHATRHTYAVEVYRKTRDIRLTQRLLGHSSVSTTMVYASLLDEDLRRAVEQVWAA
jgi:site-specific recombinase XerD